MLNPFRTWRERREAAAAADRAHQLAVINAVVAVIQSTLDSAHKQSSEQAQALMAIATSNAKQAESFAEWLKCFHTVETPTSSVVREEDEYYAEQQRLADHGFPADLRLEDVPPEFKLALALQRDIAASSPQ